MEDYRLYRLDAAGQIMLVERVEASDDTDAIRQAHLLGKNGLKCEVWQDRRLVTTLDDHDLAQ